MHWAKALSVPCTNVFTTTPTVLHTDQTVSPPVVWSDVSNANGPLLITAAVLHITTDISTTVSKPSKFHLSLDLGPYTLVRTIDYGTGAYNLFNGTGPYVVDSHYSGGTALNAFVSPGVDSQTAAVTGAGSNMAAYTTAGGAGGLGTILYDATSSMQFVLNANTQRASGSAVVTCDINVYVVGTLLPPLRDP